MKLNLSKKVLSVCVLMACGSAFADETPTFGMSAVAYGTTTPAPTLVANPVLQPWMHQDIGAAWKQGFQGQGATITVVDDFSSASKYSGIMNGTTETQRHGEWTREESSLVAPSATMKSVDYNNSSTALVLNPGLNVVNGSYGLYAKKGYSVSQIGFGTLQTSVINSAKNGTAVVVKAAGNDSVAINAANASGNQDYLNLALKGAPSAIYVGALNTNGSTSAKATLAKYSNTAGTDTAMQSHYLVAGVEGNKTGLYGTSFAAPIVSGYAAVLGSKFTTATPTQITNQLLATARTDTIVGYKAAIHGRGEASLSRALAPVSIK